MTYKKKCPRCKVSRTEEYYHRRQASADGLDTYCKICRNTELKEPTTLETTQDPYVKEGAEKVLTNLGYELYNPDRPIWKQFNQRCKVKYGITFKE